MVDEALDMDVEPLDGFRESAEDVVEDVER